MINKCSDKDLERSRYDKRAEDLASLSISVSSELGSQSIPLPLREPYLEYEQLIGSLISEKTKVLELCSGMGEHTFILLQNSGHLTVTDISYKSLDVLRKRLPQFHGLEIQVCDIENLPFSPCSFDLVACAGGLSYGSNLIVMKEIYRVLKPGGHFVCIDSLDDNPIYRINRFIHYLRGRRSYSTLKCMPTMSLLREYKSTFSHVSVRYFGAFSWLVLPFACVIGEHATYKLSNWLDHFLGTRSMAFKFVLFAQKS